MRCDFRWWRSFTQGHTHPVRKTHTPDCSIGDEAAVKMCIDAVALLSKQNRQKAFPLPLFRGARQSSTDRVLRRQLSATACRAVPLHPCPLLSPQDREIRDRDMHLAILQKESVLLKRKQEL